ncbi:hypothetical protein FLM55_04165 [Francisella sp. Scap27]|uniref:hypothetical protein n=1 Tax=Francisella sp. Scap27 TaxID=2589986 RepID=UPI0015BA93CA|nr:hypothetical protein [Francisella sp. Scap27]QLE78970.1 hypothetical protein FLM55_04165 [Francisella sp. Scap27]
MTGNNTPFYTKHYEASTLSFYTREDLRFDLLITCPHAELGKNFIEVDYPELIDKVGLKKKDFEDFLSIEYDFGTHTLSHQIAAKLFREHGICTLVFEPSFPRSVLDAGRLYPNCIRNIVDYEKHPDLKESLVNLYEAYMAKLCHVVAVAKNYNALAIDLHTMSSYSPDVVQERYSEAISETPDNLLKYISLYKNSHKDGEKRSIELFSGDARNGIFASTELLKSLYREIQARDIMVQFDKPYILAEHLVAHYLVCELSAVCIDIPKDLVSRVTTEDEDYDIANLEIDDGKLEIMASIFTSSVVKARDLLKLKEV